MTPAQRYSTVAILLHWGMALLLIAMVVAGWVMTDDTLPRAAKFQLYQLHKSTGLLILCLTFFRLFWRLTHRENWNPL